MMKKAQDPNPILWEPSESFKDTAEITRFMHWLAPRYGPFKTYADLWTWSVSDLEGFWGAVFEYFLGYKTDTVLVRRVMPGAEWFPHTRLNFAEEILRRARRETYAVYFANEEGLQARYTYRELHAKVAGVAATLKSWGIKPGDRVAAYLPNIPETLVAFLATASIGAVWSVCSPDFGSPSVVDRFQQIAPRVLFVVDGYPYNGKRFDRRPIAHTLVEALPSIEHIVTVPYLAPEEAWGFDHPGVAAWDTLMASASEGEIHFEPLPFQHPLWILYSSGTTGLPKPIVHGHGGMLLTHLVNAVFHLDLGSQDQFFWFSTTGWMMWNVVISGLLSGSGILLYDGSPSYPTLNHLWDLCEALPITVFGTSAAYVHGLMKAGFNPGQSRDLSSLRTIATTGSPLNPEAYDWVYRAIKSDVQLAPASGGTDVCSPFVGGVPLLPVRRGEMQCRILGTKVEAYDENGESLLNTVGELVITEPMPAMPLFFWGDDTHHTRYHQSYFSKYPGVWTHGDWIRITDDGGVIILGRSDSTLNLYGVRMGSAEIYRAVDQVAQVEESLVVEFSRKPGASYMPLFVKLMPGTAWSISLEEAIRDMIKTTLSPRHLPNAIIPVTDIPKTLNGKKLEIPIKRILMGEPPGTVVNVDAMMNPESLREYIAYSQSL